MILYNNMESKVESSSLDTTVSVLIGRVKWFNNKAGYGFITVTDGEHSGKDVFVHHSYIKVSDEQYKYLIQGEYVNFNLDNTPNGNHEIQAANVSGINGGKLMCETRREFRETRTAYSKTEEPSSQNEIKKILKPRESKEWKVASHKLK